jgi:hypothetical protein
VTRKDFTKISSKYYVFYNVSFLTYLGSTKYASPMVGSYAFYFLMYQLKTQIMLFCVFLVWLIGASLFLSSNCFAIIVKILTTTLLFTTIQTVDSGLFITQCMSERWQENAGNRHTLMYEPKGILAGVIMYIEALNNTDSKQSSYRSCSEKKAGEHSTMQSPLYTRALQKSHRDGRDSE